MVPLVSVVLYFELDQMLVLWEKIENMANNIGSYNVVVLALYIMNVADMPSAAMLISFDCRPHKNFLNDSSICVNLAIHCVVERQGVLLQ